MVSSSQQQELEALEIPKKSFDEEETKTPGSEADTPGTRKVKLIRKFKSDLDVLTKEKTKTDADEEKLSDLKQKQIETNPYKLDDKKLESQVQFLDQGISALRSISNEFDTIINQKEVALQALSESGK